MIKLIISGAAALAIIIIALFLIPFDLPALPLNQDMAGAAGKVLAGLLVVALMLERALAVFNDLLFGPDRTSAQSKVAIARLASTPAGAAELKTAMDEVDGVDMKRERLRLFMGLAGAFIIAAAGVRTIVGLVPAGQALTHFQTMVDIWFTAGLLAGGSNGLAKLIDVIQEGAAQRARKLRLT